MTKKSREEEFWAIFTEGGVTPIEINLDNPQSVEQGVKEIGERISQAVTEIQASQSQNPST